MTFIPLVVSNVSVGNSNTVPLTGGQTFIGTAEDVSIYASISVAFAVLPTSATGNLFFQFSNTSSFNNIIVTSTVPSTSTVPTFTNDLIPSAQFFRLKYVNDATNQTSMTIHTIYQPQGRVAIQTTKGVYPLNDYTDMLNTRAVLWGKSESGLLNENVTTNGAGSLSVGIADPRMAFGDVQVAEKTPISQIDFVYGINTIVTSNSVSNAATVSSSGGLLQLQTSGSTANSCAFFQTKKYVKYRSCQSPETNISANFGTPKSNTIQFIGSGFVSSTLASPNPTTKLVDGCGFGYNGLSFGTLWVYNGTQSWTPQASWNYDTMLGGTKSGVTLVPSNNNFYKVKFQYSGDILYYIMNPLNSRWVLVNILQTLNGITTPIFTNPTMPMMWYVSGNAYVTNSVTLQSVSGGQFLEGIRRFCGPKGAWDAFQTLTSATASSPNVILALQNAVSFNGIPNRSQLHIRYLNLSATSVNQGPYIYNCRVIRNPTSWSTLPTFTAYNGTGSSNCTVITGGQSTASYYNGASGVTISGGNIGLSFAVTDGQCFTFDVTDHEIVLYPGDVLCFCAYQAASKFPAIGWTVNWVEDL